MIDFFMSLSYRLQVVCNLFVPNTGKSFVILGVSVAMHGRQDSTTLDHGFICVEEYMLEH